LNWKEKRFIVITNDSIYCVKKRKEIKREIKIIHLSGITINLSRPSEIVMHVSKELDLRLLTK